jgi:hypothetical protein
VSWYYSAGIDGEFKACVERAGGQYEGVDIRATLLWNNRNDLDLHVITPSGKRVYYGDKQDRHGGYLDVDMNVRGETDTPVENTRWPRGCAPSGRYKVIVWNYRFHEAHEAPTPFQVELEVNGELFHASGTVSPRRETQTASEILVFQFDYKQGERLKSPPFTPSVSASASPGSWNIEPKTWSRVAGIVGSPNLWGERQHPQFGKHTFFLLDGCKDGAKGRGRGFFTETLRSDLREIWSTLEAYAAKAEIADAPGEPACGLGYVDTRPWNLLLRVKTATSTATYLIDRQD